MSRVLVGKEMQHSKIPLETSDSSYTVTLDHGSTRPTLSEGSALRLSEPFKNRPRWRKASRSATWGVIVSTMGILGLLAACCRSFRREKDIGDTLRRLAGGEAEGEDEREQSAIVEMCLDMLEENGNLGAVGGVLPERAEALPQIVASLSDYEGEHQRDILSARVLENSSTAGQQVMSPLQPRVEIIVLESQWQQNAGYSHVPLQEEQPHGAELRHNTPSEGASSRGGIADPIVPSMPHLPRVGGPSGGSVHKQVHVKSGSTSGISPSSPSTNSSHHAGYMELSPSLRSASERLEPALKDEQPGPSGFSTGPGSESTPLQVRGTKREGTPMNSNTKRRAPRSGKRGETHPAHQQHFSSESKTQESVDEAQEDEILSRVVASVKARRSAESSRVPVPGMSAETSGSTSPSTSSPTEPDSSVSQRHFFYRLPVFEGGEVKQEFRHEAAFATPVPKRNAVSILNQASAIMMLPKLTPSDAEELISLSEEVASILFQHHGYSVRPYKPVIAVQHLGRRYVLFDMLLSVVQLLGTPMNAERWWHQLVESVPTDYDRDSDGTKWGCLAKRLSGALALIKKGTRPSEAETIYLKTKLFCEDNSPLRYQAAAVAFWKSLDETGHEPREHKE